jgi:hypothetical protein
MAMPGNATFVPPPAPLLPLSSEVIWDEKKVNKDYKK